MNEIEKFDTQIAAALQSVMTQIVAGTVKPFEVVGVLEVHKANVTAWTQKQIQLQAQRANAIQDAIRRNFENGAR